MSQSTIKMDKGYYLNTKVGGLSGLNVAIHNKNGQGLLLTGDYTMPNRPSVAIHNKNGQGLLLHLV